MISGNWPPFLTWPKFHGQMTGLQNTAMKWDHPQPTYMEHFTWSFAKFSDKIRMTLSYKLICPKPHLLNNSSVIDLLHLCTLKNLRSVRKMFPGLNLVELFEDTKKKVDFFKALPQSTQNRWSLCPPLAWSCSAMSSTAMASSLQAVKASRRKEPWEPSETAA